MDKLTQWNMKSVLGSVRKSDPSYQRASHESDGGESLLSEEKPGDRTDGEDSLSLGRQSGPRSPWMKYVFFLMGLAVYSFLLIKLVPRDCSESECGKRVSLWCKCSLMLLVCDLLTVQHR